MTMVYAKALQAAALSALALRAGASATIRVDVGLNDLVFNPESIKASIGDVLEYHFHPTNHSVVMGNFSNPCAPAENGGFYSGFLPTSNGEADSVFQVTVNSTEPMFFYCAQNGPSHCKSGMSGVVNPSSDQTLKAYQSAAKSVTSATNPDAPFGGAVVAASEAKATSSPSPSPASGGSGGSGGSGSYGPYGGGGAAGGASKPSNTAGGVQASVGVVGAFALGIAVLLL